MIGPERGVEDHDRVFVVALGGDCENRQACAKPQAHDDPTRNRFMFRPAAMAIKGSFQARCCCEDEGRPLVIRNASVAFLASKRQSDLEAASVEKLC